MPNVDSTQFSVSYSVKGIIPKKSGVICLSQILLQFLTKFFFDDGIVRVINKIISKMTYSCGQL